MLIKRELFFVGVFCTFFSMLGMERIVDNKLGVYFYILPRKIQLSILSHVIPLEALRFFSLFAVKNEKFCSTERLTMHNLDWVDGLCSDLYKSCDVEFNPLFNIENQTGLVEIVGDRYRLVRTIENGNTSEQLGREIFTFPDYYSTQISKDRSFCVGLEFRESKSFFYLNWIKKYHKSVNLIRIKLADKVFEREERLADRFVALSCDNTQCITALQGIGFDLPYPYMPLSYRAYDDSMCCFKLWKWYLNRITEKSLLVMNTHNIFRLLLDFKEFEQQAFPEPINLDHEFNLSEEKRNHLINYAQFYADRTERFLEHK